jgi:hypothetical protein
LRGRNMIARRWIFLTFAIILAVVGVLTAVAYALDPYGVLRDPTGRSLKVFDNERKVKFLMNKRYVPANFNGLIVGTSASANWDMPILNGIKIYNESLEGGDAPEERILVNEAMQTGHYKLAILILSHAMTKEHSIKDQFDKVNITAAIGSLYLIEDEVRLGLLLNHRRFTRSDTAPNGQIELLYHKNLTPKQLPSDQLRFDPIALQQYRDLVNSLISAGTKIVYVVPPMHEPCYQLNKATYNPNLQTGREFLPPGPIIDFNGPEYLALRSDTDNYLDCWHLSSKGAAKVTAVLEELVPKLTASNK